MRLVAIFHLFGSSVMGTMKINHLPGMILSPGREERWAFGGLVGRCHSINGLSMVMGVPPCHSWMVFVNGKIYPKIHGWWSWGYPLWLWNPTRISHSEWELPLETSVLAGVSNGSGSGHGRAAPDRDAGARGPSWQRFSWDFMWFDVILYGLMMFYDGILWLVEPVVKSVV